MTAMFDKLMLSNQAEKEFEWRKWATEIPFIKFPQDWEIQVIPPLTGAVVRFRINTPHRKDISVYLDCYEVLGLFDGKPYWEVYPTNENDIARFAMNDIEGLLKEIEGFR